MEEVTPEYWDERIAVNLRTCSLRRKALAHK